MVRTQIYLTAKQHRRLRRAAAREGLSMTELLRRLVDRHLTPPARPEFSKEAVMSFIGLGESGRDDISQRHDEAIAEAFRVASVR